MGQKFCLHWPTQDISFFYFPYIANFICFHSLVMAQVFHDKDGTKHHNMEGSSRDGSPVEKLEHAQPGYGHERDERAIHDIEDENPNVYHHMCFKLFTGLTAMSFLWVGSQIPLYLFGALLPDIYTDIGGAERYQWMVIGYLIPNASLCPFVGALSDMFGRRWVAAAGQVLLIVGPVVTATANTMNTAIGGQVISGLGAGLNELIALAGTAELVPTRKRGSYVGAVVFTILPFCPSVLWAQLIAKASVWRYVGALIAAWNAVGLILLIVGYKDPVRLTPVRPKKEILREVDWIGGFLSTAGVTMFMAGMQWGASQYPWSSIHVLVPFVIGIMLIIQFFVYEVCIAKYPMVPAALFRKAPRTMSFILLITFFSGGNFFVLLLFYPTQVYNMYGDNHLDIGLRALPIGFGIIFGAVIALVAIPLTKGRTTMVMIFSTIVMTAGTGAMSVGETWNLPTVLGIVSMASLGVGAVIIPCSIIAQLACPHELVGTITAITLAIRYVGGAIGFTAYYNVFYHKFVTAATTIVGGSLAQHVTTDLQTLTELVTLAGEARFDEARHILTTSPNIIEPYNGQYGMDLLINKTQEAFALAYRWPYWMSIAFGGMCIVCSLFLKDVRHFVEAG
ncbi:hypothetical protein D0868_14817 [Hortaea werneckii]|uniref:Major facilitator superfamily (MFS) profile domain-containing protein n=1 Tax=Hortaea werneckii TaxID=91943 RepID=A0A3M6XD79_HORWE|nr:hypothetical protein D0868_14817 [Hortaea werneckii]